MPTGRPNLSASLWICSASSRVGAMMSTVGPTVRLPVAARHFAMPGSRNPSVLPEPVFAMDKQSRPVAASGHVAACTGDGVVKGCALSIFTSCAGNGALSKLMHGGGAAGSWMVISCSAMKAFSASTFEEDSATLARFFLAGLGGARPPRSITDWKDSTFGSLPFASRLASFFSFFSFLLIAELSSVGMVSVRVVRECARGRSSPTRRI